MAVPARKTSKARKNKRRSSVWKMDAPTLVKCSNCAVGSSAKRIDGLFASALAIAILCC